MSDLSITAANVVSGSNAVVERGTAAASITAGQIVYKESATGAFKLADSNSATAEARVPYGIALNGAAASQPIAVQREGDLTLGSVLTAGTDYFLSSTPGGVCVRADLTTGMYPSLLGIAKSSSVLAMKINSAGIAL